MDDRGAKAGRLVAREGMLGEMIDVTAFLMRMVESYA
jgi:hypothetical protein